MEIVVNDTNIFIDLYSINLLDDFFRLPLTVHTVDFVLNEILDKEQQGVLSTYISNKRLIIGEHSVEDLTKVFELFNDTSGNLSLVDCSVWYYAMKHDYILLTGDRQLRNKAINSNVNVKGIIYIFDELVEYHILTPSRAVEKLRELQTINPRLPKSIIEERIGKWSSQ